MTSVTLNPSGTTPGDLPFEIGFVAEVRHMLNPQLLHLLDLPHACMIHCMSSLRVRY